MLKIAKILKKGLSLLGQKGTVPVIVFLLSLALTVPLLPTTVSFEDSGEFVTAAATFGMPHPSGYPLYVLLAHPFNLLPLGTLPWRVALFSALCASAALAGLFLVARRLSTSLAGGRLEMRHEAPIAFFILQLGVSEIWWSQAIYAKMYALHALLLTALTYAMVRWYEDGRSRWLSAVALLFGLSLSNHLFLTLAAAPFFALAILFGPAALRPRGPSALRQVLRLAGWFLLGLLPYLQLPISAALSGAYEYGRHATLGDLLRHVMRSGYADVGTAGWNKAGILASIAARYTSELGLLAVFVAAFGLWRLRKNRWGGIGVWLAGVILSFPLIVLMRRFGWSPEIDYIYRVYALPGLAAAALAAAVGAVVLIRQGEKTSKVASVILFVCAAIFPVVSAFTVAPRVMAFSDGYAERYGREMLRTLPADAVLVVSDEGLVQDTELFVLSYLQMVEKTRADVTVISDVVITPFTRPALPMGYGTFPLAMRRRMLLEASMASQTYAERPIFTTFAPESAIAGVRSRTNGLVYAIARPGNEPVPPIAADLQEPDDSVVTGQFALRILVSHALYGRASYLLETSGNHAALGPLIKAIALDPFPASNDYRAFVAHRQSVR